MGGKAFAHHNPPLFTPRIPSDLYQRLRDHYVNVLSTLFEYAASPTAAPDKTDHGDIDILVASPRESISKSPQPYVTSLEISVRRAVLDLLQPAGFIQNSETISLAVERPEQAGSYIQLDVHVVPTVRQWHWLVFQHSYGDAWNLIGTSLHKFGLVGTDKGLFVRDAEIEAVDGKKGRIFLSDDPHAVLLFLGLNPDNWLPSASATPHVPAEPFTSSKALFTAITKTRFFQTEHFTQHRLRSGDRQRVMKRDQYREFVEIFLPRLEAERARRAPATGRILKPSSQPILQPALVFDEALTFFNATQEWQRVKQAWLHNRAALLARRAIKEERRSAALEEEMYCAAWILWVRA